MRVVVYIIVIVILCFTACKKSKPTEPDVKNPDNSILSIKADTGQVGETQITSVDDSAKILIYVKNGIALNAVKLMIVTAEKATVKPASGEIVDFSGDAPVVYTTTSQSGVSKKWHVQIKVYPAADLSKYVPNAQPDPTFNNYFTRFSGWNSGDGAQSILLPDGRTVWMFGDSFIGDVNPDRSLVSGKYALVHNAMMVQQDSTFTTYHSGSDSKPESLFNPESPQNIIWASHGVADKGNLNVFMMELAPDNKGNWTHLTNHMAILDTKDFKIKKKIKVPYYNKISWGERCYTDANYHYIFGMSTNGLNTVIHLARAKHGHLEEMWEFYAGNNTWIKDINRAVPISVKPYVTAPSIIERNGRYYMVTQRNFFSRDILMFRADNIQGPYKDEVKLYTTPDVSQSYISIVHPHFTQDNRMLIGYSLGGDIFKMVKNIDIGRPMFIRVNLPE
ncbi:hypothetical protein DJ568_06070 [Mucilaginibacter hurinus]|uniref:DUF4185 domain-containing protein n=1 Tax=Mucilaginibacter hurinus TaxID=2201324 RepID=A0A367GPS2_9SPHI|nr:DUF5005 domain-containing protein [Mucilaginibacter hurinus]RCH55459.1 hypothetical protein DJ568_06070 [Mucilaginibacter hurinus]